MVTLKVLIVGGGVGGLCLAQGLRQSGVAVEVFERDPTADTRGQGYRLRIDEHGIAALARCLPDDLFRLFRATANPPYPPRGAVFDHRLEQIETWGADPASADPARASTVANRRTLREVLLAGLGDAVAFGREVTAVTATAERACVLFRDGAMATGDLVVAADGVNSVVRRQLLPHAELFDTGLVGTSRAFYRVWAGPKFVYSRFDMGMRLAVPPGASQPDLATFEGHGFYYGGQGGAAIGWKHVFFAFELTITVATCAPPCVGSVFAPSSKVMISTSPLAWKLALFTSGAM